MISATDARSGKGHTDENFPVASRLIHKRHRPAIMAFYNFVRAGDDVADHPDLPSDEKIRLLDQLDAALTGDGPADAEAEPLRVELAARSMSPRHARDLLDAFRLDARKNRYADWSELIAYCSLSAMPVGRFVLDVHGEDPHRTWATSDAICAALQIINHLQDCGKDFRSMDRVYLPQDILDQHGARIADLSGERATPQLRAAFTDIAQRTEELLDEGRPLLDAIVDTRLALEISAIHRLAKVLVKGLQQRDPLSEKVHFSKLGFAATTAASALGMLARRTLRAPVVRSARA
jgi:hydroxysqualene synthase